MSLRAPSGSVQALSSSAIGLFALGMAFLGYWGFSNTEEWVLIDAIVVVPAFLGFLCLAYVPWIITKPVTDDDTPSIQIGRKAFALGTALILIAVFLALFV